jgi:RNA polymerase sigma-70 factor (ECF subfamily)
VSRAALELAARAVGGRIIAALAARFRDLDLAEDAFAEACARAAETWPADGAPADPAAWLYRTAERRALDAIRRARTRDRAVLDPPPPEPTPEELMAETAHLIPDERLRLIFVCCHPAVAPEARAALTLRLVCGLTTLEIARAFLVPEPTLAQRLVRAKRKIAQAGVPFEIPRPEAWPERMQAVLSTLEIAYAKAHEDAAGAGAHAGYAQEMLALTGVLAELVPDEAEVRALAAIVRYAEARRPARLDDEGLMVPLSEQDPALWRRPLIAEADAHLGRAVALEPYAPQVLQAAIHGLWAARRSLEEPPPWRRALVLYNRLVLARDDVVVRLNRAVVLAEVDGPAAALAEVEALGAPGLDAFQPWHAVRADLLRRTGQAEAARAAYGRALELCAGPAERLWLERRRAAC